MTITKELESFPYQQFKEKRNVGMTILVVGEPNSGKSATIFCILRYLQATLLGESKNNDGLMLSVLDGTGKDVTLGFGSGSEHRIINVLSGVNNEQSLMPQVNRINDIVFVESHVGDQIDYYVGMFDLVIFTSPENNSRWGPRVAEMSSSFNYKLNDAIVYNRANYYNIPAFSMLKFKELNSLSRVPQDTKTTAMKTNKPQDAKTTTMKTNNPQDTKTPARDNTQIITDTIKPQDTKTPYMETIKPQDTKTPYMETNKPQDVKTPDMETNKPQDVKMPDMETNKPQDTKTVLILNGQQISNLKRILNCIELSADNTIKITI